MGTLTSTSEILSLFSASFELKWGLSSCRTGEGGTLLASSSTCWLSRTGSFPPLLPPTTGILLSPDAFTCGVFLSLEELCRLVRDSFCTFSVLDNTAWAPCASVLLGLTSCPSTDTCPLPFIDQSGGVEGREVTGQGAGVGAERSLETEAEI